MTAEHAGHATGEESPACHVGSGCVTCSDTAVVVRVVRLLGDDIAVVDTGHGHEEISVALVAPEHRLPGTGLLVHAKEAIGVPSMTDAMSSLYPFLYAGESGTDGAVDAVLAEARESTMDKVREIMELRDRVHREQRQALADCGAAMAERFAGGGRLFSFGNGGSSTDAQDIATQFMNPPEGTRPLPAFALTAEAAVVTALSNDVGFDVVFSRQIAAFGRKGDIAVGLSTSGNSANLLAAFDQAHRIGMLTVGITGYIGGRMAELDSIDHLFVVPSPSVHRIQEAQTTIYHVLAELAAEGAR